MIGLSPESWDPSVPVEPLSEAKVGWGLVDGVRIASLGRRLGAYGVDLLVIWIILVAFLVIHPLPSGVTWQSIVAEMLALLGYMTASQLFTHNTIGKYLLGIQVVNDRAGAGLPSVRQILIRETVGRILSLQFLLGYWFARDNPKRQAWSDQMADTVVVMRDTSSSVRRSLIFGIVVSCLGCFAFAGYTAALRQSKIVALARQITQQGAAVDQIGGNIEKLRRQGKTLEEIQENHRKVVPLLDQYDEGLRQLRVRTVDLAAQNRAPAAANALQAALATYANLLERSGLERQQAELILSYETGTPIEKMRRDLAPLNAKIFRLARQQAAIQAGKQRGR